MSQDSHEESLKLRQSPTNLTVGAVVDDRFEIVGYLGCGGMGSVYRARQVQMERDVALKVLHPRFTSEVGAVQRFQREAHIISRLNHANILMIYAFGAHDGFVYIAMEFVKGQSLGQLLHSERLPRAKAVPLLIEICEAMAHAHANEVLHRDLKPDNVMIATDSADGAPHAKVVDFGLSKLADAQYGKRLTKTGEVVGDPRYMSPEQCRGEKLDVRSDIYSFGCLMYEVLTGVLPFDADSAVAIMHKHISEAPQPFAVNLALPQGLESIAFNAMAKLPKHRYDSFEQVIGDLRRVCESENIVIPLKHTAIRRFEKAPVLKTVMLVLLLAAVLSAVATNWTHLRVAGEWISYLQSPPASLSRIATGAELGRGYAEEGDVGSAIRYYTEAGELATRELQFVWIAKIYNNLGNLYASRGQNLEAEQTYARSLWGVQALLYKGSADSELFAVSCSSMRGLAKAAPPQAVRLGRELSALYTNLKQPQKAQQILELAGSVPGL